MTDEANLSIVKKLKPYPDKTLLHTAGSLSMNIFENMRDSMKIFSEMEV